MKFLVREHLIQEYVVEAKDHQDADTIFREQWTLAEKETFRLYPDPEGEIEIMVLP